MKLKDINITQTVEEAKALLAKEEHISPTLKAVFNILILVITLLAARFKLTSKNSSTPPSQDPNRDKKSDQNKEKMKKIKILN